MGWSRKKLAEMAGLHVNTLAAIEKGESTPQPHNLERIATELGVTVDVLLHGEEERLRRLLETIRRIADPDRPVSLEGLDRLGWLLDGRDSQEGVGGGSA